jgi:hypothetical protein
VFAQNSTSTLNSTPITTAPEPSDSDDGSSSSDDGNGDSGDNGDNNESAGSSVNPGLSFFLFEILRV